MKGFLTKHLEAIRVIVLVQAILATLGSLYYSNFGDPAVNWIAGEIFPLTGGFAPCTLCWFARILMYPIVLLGIVGFIKKDKKWTDYVIPMAIIGTGLEIYHYVLQKVDIQTAFECTSANPCDAFYVDYFGFITIPFMCLVAFMVILIGSLINSWLVRKK